MINMFFTRRKTMHHPDTPLVQYRMGAVILPSTAQEAVFEPITSLPISLMRGPGKLFSRDITPIESARVYDTPMVQPVGLGGSGVVVDPYNFDYGLIDPNQNGKKI